VRYLTIFNCRDCGVKGVWNSKAKTVTCLCGTFNVSLSAEHILTEMYFEKELPASDEVVEEVLNECSNIQNIKPLPNFEDCEFFSEYITRKFRGIIRNEAGYLVGEHYPHCTLTKRKCQSDVFEECKFFQRVKKLIEKALSSRPYCKRLIQQEKDYVLYAFKKINPEHSCHILINGLQKIGPRLLTEKCRASVACPCKALLPEYDVK